MIRCERCGISEEDYGSELGSYSGEVLCEECQEEVMAEEESE